MPVTESTFTLEGPQKDGSRWCREVHAVTGGDTVEFYYLTPPDFDPAPTMAARIASVNALLADSEAERSFERDARPVRTEMTMAQFATRLRERYKSTDKVETCRMAWWLLRRIVAGDFTDTQVRSAFGLTAAQWTNFKTNTLTPQSNAWAAIITATGS